MPTGVQGVRLVFYDSRADVLLLDITATIPDKFTPYLLGFDASEDAVPDRAVGIHHPNGNVKRISYANSRRAQSPPGDCTGSACSTACCRECTGGWHALTHHISNSGTAH